jgi:RNA polymerase sigma-70 factor (ECF subfamily)
MNDILEETLVSRMKSGDIDAFTQLYNKYKPSVYRTACLVSGNSADGEDITQETFVKVFVHCKELKSDKMFRYWLFKILNRTAWQFLNSQKSEIPDDNIIDKADSLATPTTEDTILQSEKRDEVYNAVMTLDYNLRIVVILYYYNEMSVKQISKVIGCHEGTVKSRLYIARKRLEKLVKAV